MELFLRVKKVFESLSQLGSSSQRALFSTRLSQLSPVLRYCEYNLKRAEGENASSLLDLLSSADNSQLSQQLSALIQKDLAENSEALRVVSFRGLFLPVDSDELRQALQEVRAAEQALLRLRDSRGEAEERALKTDKKRASYYNFYSNKKWGAVESYHLSVDSGAINLDNTARLILDFAQMKDPV